MFVIQLAGLDFVWPLAILAAASLATAFGLARNQIELKEQQQESSPTPGRRYILDDGPWQDLD